MARNAYLDEAGIGNPVHERHVVVAGVILHVDTQWRALHEHFQGLIERFVPPEHREGFIFHAKDIWHGEGEVFAREKWKGRDRFEPLRALCDTVAKFELPVVWGDCSRDKVSRWLSEEGSVVTPESVMRVAYMSSFTDCAIRAEQFMQRYGEKECLSLVIENNHQLKKYAQGTFKEIRQESSEIRRYMEVGPIHHIIDAPSFMDKDDAPPLQLADTCAFILKRYWGGKGDVSDFMVKLLPSMMHAFSAPKLAELIARLKAQEPQ